MKSTYRVEVRRIFFENVDKVTGDKVVGRSILRQLFLEGEFVTTNLFKITKTTRNGVVRYSISRRVSAKPPVHYPWQAKLPWFDDGRQKEKWVKEGPSLNQKDAAKFIARMLGSKFDAIKALKELAVAEPASRKKNSNDE